MVTVDILADSKYQVNRAYLRSRISKCLEKQGVSGRVLVSVSIVGDRKMRSINKQYRNKDYATDVLSFPTSDPSQAIDDHGFFQAPDLGLMLGDIVISYPQAVTIASVKNQLLDEVIGDLAEHGLLHLLGIHHEE